MVFSSYQFIFVFLPIVLASCWTLRLFAPPSAAVILIGLASLWFFAAWDWHYLPLLLVSILFNYTISGLMFRQPDQRWRRRLLIGGVTGNLVCLGYFKYFNFTIASIEALLHTPLDFEHVLLPIGISFYTFTQIAYLVDTYRDRERPYPLTHYNLFVTIFPHLIAGPIIHHKEMMPQFRQDSFGRFDLLSVNSGIIFFSIGLAKKVLVADNIAPLSDAVFLAASRGDPLSAFEAWAGTLAYAMQLYFDFSGYADMAIGLGLLIGVRLPQNFNRPYRSLSISDFWRRWHITLSRFLRNYLYIPLGGNRKGFPRLLVNLFITMLLGGIWHGAGWTFIIWGMLHGSYLVVERLLERFFPTLRATPMLNFTRWFLTFVAVLVAWVPFRATDLPSTLAMWDAMAFGGATLPMGWYWALGPIGELMQNAGATFNGAAYIQLREWVVGLPLLAGAFALALFLPRTESLADSVFGMRNASATEPRPVWRAAVASVLFVSSLIYLSYNTVFLYFQF